MPTLDEFLQEKYTNFVSYIERFVISDSPQQTKDAFASKMRSPTLTAIRFFVDTEVRQNADDLDTYVKHLCTKYDCKSVADTHMKRMVLYLTCFLDIINSV